MKSQITLYKKLTVENLFLCALLVHRRKRIIGMFPRSLPFILLMSHASKLLQTLFLKHNYSLKKKNKYAFKI